MRLKPHQQEKFQRRRRLLAHEHRMRAVEHARHYAETVKRLLVEGKGAGLRELGRRLETAGVQPVSVWTPRPGPGRPPKASWSTSQVRALLRQVEALTAPPPRSIKWRLGRAASLHARAATLGAAASAGRAPCGVLPADGRGQAATGTLKVAWMTVKGGRGRYCRPVVALPHSPGSTRR
jgi:hypothetical protein